MNTNTTNTTSEFKKHVFLENLCREKFGVFLEVQHVRFDTPISNYRNKPIIARTMVAAYRSKEEAIAANKNKGTINPICITTSECALGDQFVKRVGLAKALERMYRVLALNSKGEVHN